MHSGTEPRTDILRGISATFPVTARMVPSARIVAYYIRGREIVSNSIWFEVAQLCSWVKYFTCFIVLL